MNVIIGSREFKSSTGIVSVHDPISPVEVYEEHQITISLKRHLNEEYKNKYRVFRLSPFGVEFEVQSDNLNYFLLGQEFDLQLKVAKQKSEFFGVTVATNYTENGIQLVAVRLCPPPSVRESDVERRKADRWLCGVHFLPSGVAANPAKFNDFIYFSVLDVSSDGMQLSTSLRNKILVPGMVLDANVSFPMIGQIRLHLRIKNVRIRSSNGKDFLALGVEVLEHDVETLGTIGQYVLQFGPPLSPAEIRKAGFQVRSLESTVSYSFVKSLKEYRSVLELRKLAYSDAGKVSESVPIDEMSDVFDAKSRILMSTHNGSTVGSLRLTFHTPEEDNEYDAFVKLPKEQFPRRDEIVVLSRICTHPQYRGANLFYGLIRQCLLSAAQAKRRYILGGCSDALLPLYKKVGFRETGLYFSHKTLNSTKEQIILADIYEMLTGTSTSLFIWNELYQDLTDYMLDLQEIPFDAGMRVRLGLFRALSPITRLFTGNVRHPKLRAQ